MSGEPKTILERVQIAETYEIMRRQQTGFKTVDQWEAEISRLQQQLSDCKARAEAAEQKFEAASEAYENLQFDAGAERQRANAAEAREKQVRAETIEECAAKCNECWDDGIPAIDISAHIRALGQTEPGEQA